MSTTTSDTEAIDDKKDTTPTTNPLSGTFMATMFSKLLLLGIIVVTGTCMVYTCRVAQSNILPTDLNCYPYTNMMPIIEDIPINIDVVKTSEGIFSTQIKFPFSENMESLKFGLFGYLKNMIESKDAGNFQLYAATTIQQLLATNLAIINWIFNLYNSYFTESMIIFIVPFLLIFINFFTGIVNSFYLMFLWFYNLPLLFSVPTRTATGSTSWNKGDMWSINNWWRSLFWIFIFVLLFFILGIGLIIPILAGSITLYSILSPLFMTARKVDDPEKKYTIMDAFMNIIEYKMRVIMFIVSYFVISDAYSSYGSYSALVAIIACLLLYFFTDIYKQYIPETKTPWTNNFKQAAKSCESASYMEKIAQMMQREPVIDDKALGVQEPVPEPQLQEQPVAESQQPDAESQQPGDELQEEPVLAPVPAPESQQISTQPSPRSEIELQDLNQGSETKRPTELGPSRIPPAGPNIDNSIGNDQLGGRIKKRHSRKNVKL
jgi:hypothetical protein